MSLPTIIDKLELNSKKYDDLELILKLLDEIYENKKLFINISNDESCTLIIKFINVLKEASYEIKLYKDYLKIDDKFNIIFNQIKQIKKNNFNEDIIDKMNNKINELNNKIEQNNISMKEIMKNKDNIINEMNQKMINQENRIKELENKTIDLINKNENNTKNSINKHESEIKIMNNKITDLENIINK